VRLPREDDRSCRVYQPWRSRCYREPTWRAPSGSTRLSLGKVSTHANGLSWLGDCFRAIASTDGHVTRLGPFQVSELSLTVAHMFDTTWDEVLDEHQIAAASHGGAPLVVLAGASQRLQARTVTGVVGRQTYVRIDRADGRRPRLRRDSARRPAGLGPGPRVRSPRQHRG
jgi:hypothetical protein